MRLRILLALVVSLAFASVAAAQCAHCVRSGVGDDGYCEATWSGWCSESCCLFGAGAPCVMNEYYYPCMEGFASIPVMYFATKLPMQTEGSALRLRLGNGIPVKECKAATLLRQTRSMRRT